VNKQRSRLENNNKQNERAAMRVSEQPLVEVETMIAISYADM